MASVNAYFAHPKLEIPPNRRKSYKNLEDAANIQWHRYIKKSNNFVTDRNQVLKSTNDGTRKGNAFVVSFRSLPVFC